MTEEILSRLFVYFLPGFLLGAGLAWFLLQNVISRMKMAGESELARLGTQLEHEKAAVSELQGQVANLTAAGEESRRQISEQDRKLAALETEQKRIPELEAALDEAGKKTGHLREALEQERLAKASLEENLKSEKDRFTERFNDLKEAKEKMSTEFRAVAGKILQENSLAFQEQSKVAVTSVVKPLHEDLKNFQEKIRKNREADAKTVGALESDLRKFHELGLEMNEQAKALTSALTKNVKTQGDWGETVLETILENSGLREGEEFVIQHQGLTSENRRVRPDVLVRLPQNRAVVVDSKVSLNAYTEHANAETEAEAEAALKRHLQSLRNHINTLASKNYPDLVGESTLDTVLMFVPIESALMKGLDHDSSVFQLALDNKIALVGPTTLMLALRIIENQWRVERQNQNVQEIANRAGRMYDKFVGFTESMLLVAKRLESAGEAHHKAMRTLSEGRGNLVSQAKQIKALGSDAKKSLPRELSSAAEEEDPDA